jgi:hypothetical protein
MSSAESSPEKNPEPRHLLVLWHYTPEERKRLKQAPAWRRYVPVQSIQDEEGEQLHDELREQLQNQLEQIRTNADVITCPYTRPDGRLCHTMELRRDEFFVYSGITLSDDAETQYFEQAEPERREEKGAQLGQMFRKFLGRE